MLFGVVVHNRNAGFPERRPLSIQNGRARGVVVEYPYHQCKLLRVQNRLLGRCMSEF